VTTKRRKSPDPDSERIRGIIERLRELLYQVATIEVSGAASPIDIDQRLLSGTAAVTYGVRSLSITVDFEMFCRDTLMIADSVFRECFEGVVEPLESAVDEYVAKTLKWVDGVAIATLTDYYLELVMHAVGVASESFADDLMSMVGRRLRKSERKGFRDFARESAKSLLASRIPSVGRGGETRLAESPSPGVLIDFLQATERVYPFWRDAKQRAERDDSTWQSDAKMLPEYRRFTPAERRDACTVLALLRRGGKVNGAPAQPRVLAREHARLLLGMPQESDSKLRKHEARAKRLAENITPKRPRRRR
jgi:hypothetical protein